MGAYESAVVISSPTVPIEIIRAAAFRPALVTGSSAPTPAADAHVERDVFPRRLRHLMDAALTGELADAACIVVPRTSDVDYKCFLYLREFVRREVAPRVPPILLFDLLQSGGSGVRDYDVARTQSLSDELASLSGRRPSGDDLRREIIRANRARQAARALLALRGTAPHVTGAEVFPLLAAFWQMDPDRYAEMAAKAARDIAARPSLTGARVLLAGEPVDAPVLHQEIESHAAIVSVELGPWGSDVAGDDVRLDGDPIAALADKYRADAVGARTPIEVLRQSIEGRLHDVDAVVVSLPPHDAVFGWDYPALRDRLDACGVPHVCLRGDPYEPLGMAEHGRLDSMVAAASRLQEAGRG